MQQVAVGRQIITKMKEEVFEVIIGHMSETEEVMERFPGHMSETEERLNGQAECEFEDVAVYFSQEEWDCLKEEEKELYRDVMMENYQTLCSLGRINGIPALISAMEKGEELCVRGRRGYEDMEDHGNTGPDSLQRNYPRGRQMVRKLLINTKEESIEIKDFIEQTPSMETSVSIQDRKGAKGKTHSCATCGKNFPFKAHLERHQRSHTGETPFSCPECWKCFSLKKNLVSHMRTHTGEKPFTCSLCGKTFSQKKNLVSHEKTHTGEKPFSCPECSKCFSERKNLVRHERTHTGEKPFSCSLCGKLFTNKASLLIHERAHTGGKPFSCSVCGKCFTQKSYLLSHESTHTGERPFSCSVCGKCFSYTSALVIHQGTHAVEEP
uniref:Uncharacterized protein n=1 Tax=Leptobrachium leishanense TaxID=445787 RepID=A0A8C5RD38_9ANUR